ncbi:hypothetical protein CsatB_015593 [Cannabis sativa]
MEVEQVLHMNGGVGKSSYAKNSFLQTWVVPQAPTHSLRSPTFLTSLKPLPNPSTSTHQLFKFSLTIFLGMISMQSSDLYRAFMKSLRKTKVTSLDRASSQLCQGVFMEGFFQTIPCILFTLLTVCIGYLRYRSEEMVSGGIMILTFLGSIQSHSPNNIYEILGRTLNDMVKENIIEAKCVENFNVPAYFPSAKEVKDVIEKERSLSLQKLNTFEIDWDAGFITSDNIDNDKHNSGKYVSDYIRAVAEPILVTQFEETIMDELFNRFADKVNESMANEKWKYVNLVISLTKN